jgi:ABC-type amino acid transport substrate-binding protein
MAIPTRRQTSKGGATASPIATIESGTLTILSAYPDPPFDVIQDGVATGFDIEPMRAVAGRLGLALRPTPYTGADFNGIFEALRDSGEFVRLQARWPGTNGSG